MFTRTYEERAECVLACGRRETRMIADRAFVDI